MSVFCDGIQSQTTFMLGVNRLLAIRNVKIVGKILQNKVFIYIFTITPGILFGIIALFNHTHYQPNNIGGLVPKSEQ